MAEDKKKAAAKPIEPVVTHLQVRALSNGFRRAGRAWSTQDETVSVDEFTDEQVAQLLADPMLVVLPIADEAAGK